MVREITDNTCQHNLLNIGNERILVIGFIDSYSAFDCEYVEGRFTEELVLHDKNARYDSPNRWWRYRFFRLCRLPFKVKYRIEGSDYVFKSRPEVWIRLNRIKK